MFASFKPPRPEYEPRTLARMAAVLTTTLGPLPCIFIKSYLPYMLWNISAPVRGYDMALFKIFMKYQCT